MTPIRLRTAASLLAAGLMMSGCSSGGTDSVAAGTQNRLRQDMQTLAAAAAAGNYPSATRALAALTADADGAHAAGKLSNTQLADIRGAATRVTADLATATMPPTPTVQPTTAEPAVVQPAHPGKPDHGAGKDTGGGNNKGKGK